MSGFGQRSPAAVKREPRPAMGMTMLSKPCLDHLILVRPPTRTTHEPRLAARQPPEPAQWRETGPVHVERSADLLAEPPPIETVVREALAVMRLIRRPFDYGPGPCEQHPHGVLERVPLIVA